MTRPNIREGQRVTGTYFHVPFSGTVRSERCNTMNWSRYLVMVTLDTPIVVNDSERGGIQLDVDFTTLQGDFGTAILEG